MLGLTVIAAVLFSLLAITRRQPGAAIGVLIMSILLWPEYHRMPMGLVQMSVPRLVALFLLFKFFSRGYNQQINFCKVDRLVIWIWLWTIIATILAGADQPQITQMIGRGLDTLLIYFVVRMAVNTPTDARALFPGLALVAFVMCGMGVYEAATWHSPYHKFYFSLGNIDRSTNAGEIRYGFLRAQGSTLVAIYFGMGMMLVSAFLWSIRGFLKPSLTYKLSLLASIIAVLSSLSSGPWLALFILIGVNLYFRRVSLIKPSVYLLIFMCIVMEVASNRHFYNLIDYLALDKQTAWYRTRLLEVAVSQWQDYWLVGVGSKWPTHWAALVDGRGHIDVVNNFLIMALYGGLPSMLMYIAAHVITIKYVARAWRQDTEVARRTMLFALGAAIIALDFSSMSVGLYGPALLLSYVLLGMAVSVANSWRNEMPSQESDIDTSHSQQSFPTVMAGR